MYALTYIETHASLIQTDRKSCLSAHIQAYIYMYMYQHPQTFIYIYLCIYTYLPINMHACTQGCLICIYIHTHIHTVDIHTWLLHTNMYRLMDVHA